MVRQTPCEAAPCGLKTCLGLMALFKPHCQVSWWQACGRAEQVLFLACQALCSLPMLLCLWQGQSCLEQALQHLRSTQERLEGGQCGGHPQDALVGSRQQDCDPVLLCWGPCPGHGAVPWCWPRLAGAAAPWIGAPGPVGLSQLQLPEQRAREAPAGLCSVSGHRLCLDPKL